MSDKLLTVRDVATILQCGEDSVIRRFAKMPGVIDLGKPETRSPRRYRRPVVAIAGQIPSHETDSGYFQETCNTLASNLGKLKARLHAKANRIPNMSFGSAAITAS